MLTELLPFALGILLSPFPLVPLVVVLGSPRARWCGAAYLASWLAALSAVTVAAAVVAGFIEPPEPGPVVSAVIKGAVAVVLLILGLRQWSRRAEGEEPAWLAGLGTGEPARAARFGALMAVANPKIVVFAAGAGALIATQEPSLGVLISHSVMFAVLSSLILLLPFAASLILGPRADRWLAQLRALLSRHGSAIGAAVLIVLGLGLLVGAAQSL